MLKRLLVVMMALCMLLTVLTACGGTAGKNDGSAAKGNSDIDKALEDLEQLEDEAGVVVDENIKDLLEDIDEADIDAAAAANANSDVKVSADLAEGWERDEDTPLLLNATNGTRLLSVVGYPKPSDMNIAEYAEKNREQMVEYFPDATISAVENKRLGNYDGAGIDFEYAITKSMVQKQIYFYFFEGERAYMIQGAYMIDDEGAAGDVEAAMASIKIE